MKQKQNWPPIGELVIASHNQGKIDEFAILLHSDKLTLHSALALGLDDVEETGTSFEQNATLKAVQTAKMSGLPALGDDSGVCVDALGGEPGIYTARWAERAGHPRNWDLAMRRVAEKLHVKPTQNWSAKFVCVLALALPDGQILVERGEVEGTLIWPIRGTKGFGYDPMFVPNGEILSFGEMEPEQKHAISHRQMAFQKLLAHGLFE